MLQQYLLCLLLIVSASSQEVRYDGYQLQRLYIENMIQFQAIHNETLHSEGLILHNNLGKHVDLIVSPERLRDLENLITKHGGSRKILSQNVQKLIDQQKSKKNTKLEWDSYHDLNEIYAWLDSLVADHPDVLEMLNIGDSYEGRPLKGLKLSYKQNNPGVFLESGIHAAEWIGPATATWIINQLLNSQDPDVRFVAENFDWYIFPSVNPDGYQYSHTTDRLWRKTRSPNTGGCVGTDPNRNWDFHWMEEGAGNNPCSGNYAGRAAFSEAETRALAAYLTSLTGKIHVYLDFHSYGQLLMFPYGYTKQHTSDYDLLMQIGNKSAEALASRYGTEYTVGDIAETIYIASGSSLDWVYGKLNITFSFVYELPDKGEYGGLLPPEKIIPTAEETLDSIIVILKESRGKILRDMKRS